ncbi:MAG: metallopeptidase family protein [Alphaproteobacteria bacterium]|nr:metallopeptidase family protein [Alphaproteobacteria bacterium]
MGQGSDRVTRLLDEAEGALHEGRAAEAESLCREALGDAPRSVQAHFLLGESLRDQERFEEAEGLYRFVVLNAPDHSDAWGALSHTLVEQLRWDEARKACNRCLREDPMHPDGAFVRGVLRERRGDFAGAQRDFLRAWRSDPEGYPLPIPLTDVAVDDVVTECLELLHPTLREYLANVPIILEEVPSEELLRQYDPPAGPTQILGYFSGHSLMERSLHDPWSILPSAIVLFRRNLERMAQNRHQLIEELRITLFHEVGHFLGLDEDDLEERGLD